MAMLTNGPAQRFAIAVSEAHRHFGRFYFVKKINGLGKPYANLIKLSGLVSIWMAFLIPEGILIPLKLFLATYAFFSNLSLIYDYTLHAIDFPVPVRIPTPEFSEKVILLAQSTAIQRMNATNENHLLQAAKLEHEAFRMHSGRSVLERQERLRHWVTKHDGLAHFMLINGELVGYTTIIPVSEADADRFKKGQLKEWGMRVNLNIGSKTNYLYAQAAFLRDSLREQAEYDGIAHACALAHVAYLVTALHKEAGLSKIDMLRSMRIVASAGTLHGKRFMKNLGFREVGVSADGKDALELNLGGDEKTNFQASASHQAILQLITTAVEMRA